MPVKGRLSSMIFSSRKGKLKRQQRKFLSLPFLNITEVFLIALTSPGIELFFLGSRSRTKATRSMRIKKSSGGLTVWRSICNRISEVQRKISLVS